MPSIEVDGRPLTRIGRGCSNIDVLRDWYPEIEAVITADGVDLCANDFSDEDGGTYVTMTLPGKLEGTLKKAFCVDV